MLRFFTRTQKSRPRTKTGSGKTALPAGPARRLFHGVSVKADPIDCCRAVDAIRCNRYLADEAPLLPLAGCDRPQDCRCTYQHYEDRRTEARRDSDLGLPMKDHPDDGRTGHGRRVTDG